MQTERVHRRGDGQEYINGCVRYLVLAKSEKRAEPADLWVDEDQLEVVKSKTAKKAKSTGGSQEAPRGLPVPR